MSIFLVNNISAQVTLNADDPTLKETLDWIREKLTANANFSPSKGSAIQTVFGFEAKQFDSCEISFVERMHITGLPDRPGSLISITLGDLDPDAITLNSGLKEGTPNTRWSPIWQILLKVAANKPPIKSQTITRENRGGSIYSVMSYPISINDEGIGKRLVTAFSHAARLCRQQTVKEPF